MWDIVMPDINTSFTNKQGEEIAAPSGLGWVRNVAWGFGKLLDWLNTTYGWDIYVCVELRSA
jgi:hypothetical protein